MKVKDQVMEGIGNFFLAGLENKKSTMTMNKTGYQDEKSWTDWMKLFVVWKEKVKK